MTTDVALAQRLERTNALNVADYVHTLKRLEPTARAEVFEVGEGWGVLMGARFPINVVSAAEFGLLNEQVLLEAEERFSNLALTPRFSFCPLVPPQNLELFNKRGYQIASFMNVYARAVEAPATLPEGVEIRLVSNFEEWLEASTAAWGPSNDGGVFSRVALERPEAQSFVALVDGKPVAVAALRIRDDLAFLNGTATTAAFRGRGIQSALVQTRLAVAHQAGCDLAAVMATPSSQSARNLERLGFKLAYTRVSLEKN